MARICDDWQHPLPDVKLPNQMSILLLALLPVPPKLSSETVCADKIQQQMNADTVEVGFNLILTPMQEIAQDCDVMDCADGQTDLCFSILSAWIVDNAVHTIFSGISSKSCQLCDVPGTEHS